jgi:hypothetical protein
MRAGERGPATGAGDGCPATGAGGRFPADFYRNPQDFMGVSIFMIIVQKRQ